MIDGIKNKSLLTLQQTFGKVLKKKLKPMMITFNFRCRHRKDEFIGQYI
jgi:hypothetical protein